jgi:opacity protein-like surface antigen
VADVIVETHRLTAGVDWQPTCDMNVYLRYIYFDYGDISADLDSGTAHMVLAGATRTW